MPRSHRLAALSVTCVAVLSACGGSGHAKPASAPAPSAGASSAPATAPAVGSEVRADVLRSALLATSRAHTFRQRVLADTAIGGRTVHSVITTGYDQTARRGFADVQLPGVQTIHEVFAGGSLYLSIPGQGLPYRLSLPKLVGTQLGDAADPTQGLKVLQAQTGSIRAAGTATVDGEQMQHYTGTLDLQKALGKLGGVSGGLARKGLRAAQQTPPFDAYLDSSGRLRRVVMTLRFELQGTSLLIHQQVDTSGFGEPVVVKVPARSQDGSRLVAALRRMAASGG